MRVTRSRRGLTVAFATAVALSLGTGAASAGTFDTDYTTAANIRSGPTTSDTIYGVGYPGQGARDYCFTMGTYVNGNPYWDSNTDLATGISGYTSEEYLANKSQLTVC